jgi:hypothetical protein
MNSFKTSKGTELPLMNLKGKDYLQVPHRVVWFREDHPNGQIVTKIIEVNDNHAIVQAIVSDEKGNLLAQAHKQETKQGFGDYVEKAETGAVGRALGFAGYGTQFAGLDSDLSVDNPRLADAPVIPAKSAYKHSIPIQSATPFNPLRPPDEGAVEGMSTATQSLLDFEVTFGKYKGQKLGKMNANDLSGYLKWIEGTLPTVDKPNLKEKMTELLEKGRKVLITQTTKQNIEEVFGDMPMFPTESFKVD